jgi:fructoselysine-6-P-deglycase FrlB-like protein
MSTIKQKLLNAIAAHPKLVTLGMGLALTMAIGAAITGMFEVQQAHAIATAPIYVPHSAFASAGGGGCANCG